MLAFEGEKELGVSISPMHIVRSKIVLLFLLILSACSEQGEDSDAEGSVAKMEGAVLGAVPIPEVDEPLRTEEWTALGEEVGWEDGPGIGVARIENYGWMTPSIESRPFAFYRINFESRTEGDKVIEASESTGYFRVTYHDVENGDELYPNLHDCIYPSKDWKGNSIIVRSHSYLKNGDLVAADMRLAFISQVGTKIWIRGVKIDEIDRGLVANIWVREYERLLAHLTYQPSPFRREYLKETFRKLKEGGQVRMVFVGDSVVEDLANSNFDALLSQQYPEARIEVVCVTRGGMGVNYFRGRMKEDVIALDPDLIVFGGISNGVDYPDHFKEAFDQIEQFQGESGKTVDVLLMSKGWSPSNFPIQNYYHLNGSYKELVQKNRGGVGIVSLGYRGELLNLAQRRGHAFLDATAIFSEFIYGPASKAGVGPPREKGEPYSYWMRDYIHGNGRARMIMGRMLWSYFSPVD